MINEELERAVEDHCAREDWNAATTAAIEGYGPELLGYLTALGRSEATADEVFSDFCLDLWKGLRGFRWDSSLRTWVYRVAHRAHLRYHRSGARRAGRVVPLSNAPDLLKLVARIRTETAAHLRTSVKSEIAKLREELSDADRALLVLRVDRRLAWPEIAAVMADEHPDTDPQKLAATLRKRFERAKERLRKLAEARGLLPQH